MGHTTISKLVNLSLLYTICIIKNKFISRNMNEFGNEHNEQPLSIPQEVVNEFNDSQEEWQPIIQQTLPDLERYFLSPENFNTILDLFRAEAGNLEENQYPWELAHISKILGKMLISDSIRPTLENAKKIAQDLVVDDDPHIELFDVCSGAGISAMMNWCEIKKVHPDKTCTVIGVDKATESIEIAKTFLRLKNIPVVVVAVERIDEMKGFDGIILVQSDVTDAADIFQATRRTFHAVYSDHGIGYFDNDDHDEIIKTITQSLLKDKGVFQVCSLENNVSVELNYIKMITEILFTKDLMETIPDKQNPYVLAEKDGKAIVSAMNTNDSAALYSILQKFIYRAQFRDFAQYIQAIIRVAKATKTLANEVPSSIEYTQEVLKSLGYISSVEPPFANQQYSIARTLWYYNNS